MPSMSDKKGMDSTISLGCNGLARNPHPTPPAQGDLTKQLESRRVSSLSSYVTGIIVVMTVAIRMYHGMPSVTL
jgi:hypothetical protein